MVTSRTFLEKAKLELPGGVEPLWLEDIGAGIGLGRPPDVIGRAVIDG